MITTYNKNIKLFLLPVSTKWKKRKETTITRYFVKNANHRNQHVYKLCMEEQNNINHIMPTKQGIMRKDINEKANKQDNNIYPPTILTAQNDNLQYHDTHTTNNKYCVPINTSHPHSSIQQTRQLIYFFSCGPKKTFEQYIIVFPY